MSCIGGILISYKIFGVNANLTLLVLHENRKKGRNFKNIYFEISVPKGSSVGVELTKNLYENHEAEVGT